MTAAVLHATATLWVLQAQSATKPQESANVRMQGSLGGLVIPAWQDSFSFRGKLGGGGAVLAPQQFLKPVGALSRGSAILSENQAPFLSQLDHPLEYLLQFETILERCIYGLSPKRFKLAFYPSVSAAAVPLVAVMLLALWRAPCAILTPARAAASSLWPERLVTSVSRDTRTLRRKTHSAAQHVRI